MSVSWYVAMLSWTSAFLAIWKCYIREEWTAWGFMVIGFSLIVALLAGLTIATEKRP